MGMETGSGGVSNRSVATTAQAAPPTFRSFIVRDLNRSGAYEPKQDVKVWPPFTQVVSALVREVAADPKTKVVVQGEVHESDMDYLFYLTVKAANASKRKPVAVIETPTTPRLDQLVRDAYAGRLTPEQFLTQGSQELHRAYTAAFARRGTGGVPPRDVTFFRNRLEIDVVNYLKLKPPVPVVLADRERFKVGGNSDRGIADATLDALQAFPGRVAYLQTGIVHAQERPGLPIREELQRERLWHGAPQAALDAKRPAAARVSAKLGDRAVKTIIYDNLWKGKDGQPDSSGLVLPIVELDPKKPRIPFSVVDHVVPLRRDEVSPPTQPLR